MKNVHFLVPSLCHFRGSSLSQSNVLPLCLLNIHTFPQKRDFLFSCIKLEKTGDGEDCYSPLSLVHKAASFYYRFRDAPCQVARIHVMLFLQIGNQ